MRNTERNPPEICPACGAGVPRHAEACPECGSDYETGWNEEATKLDGLDLPDREFDYRRFVRKEFPDTMEEAKRRNSRWPYVIATLILFAILIMLLFK